MGYLQNLETALVLLPVGEMLWDAISSLYLFLLELFLPLSQVATRKTTTLQAFLQPRLNSLGIGFMLTWTATLRSGVAGSNTRKTTDE